jgi:hypothetical protein
MPSSLLLKIGSTSHCLFVADLPTYPWGIRFRVGLEDEFPAILMPPIIVRIPTSVGQGF